MTGTQRLHTLGNMRVVRLRMCNSGIPVSLEVLVSHLSYSRVMKAPQYEATRAVQYEVMKGHNEIMRFSQF